MEALAWFACLALVLVFAWSAAAKVLRMKEWREAVPRYRLPGVLTPLTVAGVPVAEAGVVILFLVGASRVAAALTLLLLAAFSMAVMRARRLEGDRLPCGCFGKTKRRDYRVMIVRNAALALLAMPVLLRGSDTSLSEGVGAPSASEIVPALLVVIGLALAGWMLWSVTVPSKRR
jgi:hypothetical protein